MRPEALSRRQDRTRRCCTYLHDVYVDYGAHTSQIVLRVPLVCAHRPRAALVALIPVHPKVQGPHYAHSARWDLHGLTQGKTVNLRGRKERTILETPGNPPESAPSARHNGLRETSQVPRRASRLPLSLTHGRDSGLEQKTLGPGSV